MKPLAVGRFEDFDESLAACSEPSGTLIGDNGLVPLKQGNTQVLQGGLFSPQQANNEGSPLDVATLGVPPRASLRGRTLDTRPSGLVVCSGPGGSEKGIEPTRRRKKWTAKIRCEGRWIQGPVAVVGFAVDDNKVVCRTMLAFSYAVRSNGAGLAVGTARGMAGEAVCDGIVDNDVVTFALKRLAMAFSLLHLVYEGLEEDPWM